MGPIAASGSLHTSLEICRGELLCPCWFSLETIRCENRVTHGFTHALGALLGDETMETTTPLAECLAREEIGVSEILCWVSDLRIESEQLCGFSIFGRKASGRAVRIRTSENVLCFGEPTSAQAVCCGPRPFGATALFAWFEQVSIRLPCEYQEHTDPQTV